MRILLAPILLFFCNSAFAMTVTKETWGRDGKGVYVCFHSDDIAAVDRLYDLAVMELEFAGYEITENLEDAPFYSDGRHTLLLMNETLAACVGYKDAYQPQIPAMYYGEE